MGSREKEKLLSNLYGRTRHPYYIYAPRWIESSAGIKALHYLCHALNCVGEEAFLVFTEPPHGGLPRINPSLKTPILTDEIVFAHFNTGRAPIVVYSETVPGNPLGGTCVVRYLMNFVGALGGPESFDETEIVYSFSKKIALDYADKHKLKTPKVLFLPPIDPREFSFQEKKRPFQVVYAGKYRSFVGRPPKVGSLDSVEIFRDGPRMQSRGQVKKLLSEASRVYSFENSSIVTEAILSGTPAHFVPNVFFTEIIAESELGRDGIAEQDTNESFLAAQKSIRKGIQRYYRAISIFFEQLEDFIKVTQARASSEGYQVRIILPTHFGVINHHRLKLAQEIFKNQGFRVLVRVIYHFVMRRLSWRYWLNDKGTRKVR